MTDPILIAGAGPVGLTLAVELARYGVPVRIIDSAAAASATSKALAIWARTLELLDRGGMAAPLVQAGLRVPAVRIGTAGAEIGRIDFSGLDTRYPFALLLPQSETERLLAARLAGLGLAVERRTTLARFADTADGVACEILGPEGRVERVTAPWLVGCDGAHSTVRKALGLSFEGDTLAQTFVLADLQVAGLPVPPDEIGIFWSRDGALMFFPIGHGRYRVIADVGEAPRHDPTLAELQAIVDVRGPAGVTLSDPVWLAGFSVNERMVSRYRVGRVLVAGDAAHLHSPAGGQGMNTGMQDAVNLAWKLALVVRGRAVPALLDSYGAERAAVARRVIAEAGRLTRVGLLKGPLAQALRDHAAHRLLGLAAVQDLATHRLSELSVGYPGSPLNRGHVAGATAALPGQRFATDRPFGAGDCPLFALCAAEDDGARAFRAGHEGLVEPVPRPALPDGLIRLVRPDGYVAAIARPGDWAVLEEALSALCTAAG